MLSAGLDVFGGRPADTQLDAQVEVGDECFRPSFSGAPTALQVDLVHATFEPHLENHLKITPGHFVSEVFPRLGANFQDLGVLGEI